MAAPIIHSLTNPIVKKWVRLRTKHQARMEEKAVLVIGSTIIKELLLTHTPRLIMVREHGEAPHNAPYYRVTDEVMEKITSLPMLPDWVAEFPLPTSSITTIDRLLVLDGIKDPGNLGTLLRTALAFNWQHVFLLGGSADPFAPKALQATKGACFHLTLHTGSLNQLHGLIKDHHLKVYRADLNGAAPQSADSSAPCALILGGEVAGISPPLKTLGHALTLPMAHKSESLNVGVAGGILMYLLRRS